MPKLTEEQIARDIVDFVKSEILANDVALDAGTLFSSVGMDSYSIIELVMLLERKHGITMQEKDMLPDNFKSAATLAKCAATYL